MSALESAIANVVARLEQVAARLERVENAVAGGASAGAGPSGAAAGGAGGADPSERPSVREYDDLVNNFIKPYVDLSNRIGDVVSEQAQLVLKAVEEQRKMLVVAAQSKKPADNVLQQLVQPTADVMGQITAIRDKNRTNKNFNHLSAVSEGIPALGWVMVSPTPAPHVGDMRGGSEFYSNRILKDFKDKDQLQVDWVKAFNGFLKELQVYVKKNHTTGLTWNAQGGDASAAKSAAPAAAPAAHAAPAAPAAAPAPARPAAGPAPDVSGLFSALNKGTDITSGLKKVTNDMKSKNNPNKSSVVPADAVKPKAGGSGPKAAGPASNKPPKLALEGNKWCVEFQVDNKQIVIEETEPRQTIYLYKCVGSVIQIKNKINSIAIDSCTKTAVVFENCLAQVEIVNCNSLEVQVLGKVPTVAIDKSGGVQLYLSKDSLETELVTSKSDNINVLIPGVREGDDLVEMAVPEQYKTVVRNGALHTEIVQHV